MFRVRDHAHQYVLPSAKGTSQIILRFLIGGARSEKSRLRIYSVCEDLQTVPDLMFNLQRRSGVRSLFIILILVTMLILLNAVRNTTMPKIATNAASYSNTHAFSTTCTGPSSTLAINCTYSTSSTPANITDTTILPSTPSAIASSSIDLYQAWVKNFTSSSMGFPLPHVVATPEVILETQWAPELWRHLSELDTKYVSLCIGNSAYKESIVNWLVAALVITQPPLENVLVISLDTKLHEFLQEHDINSVYVDPLTILRSNGKAKRKLANFWLTRLVLFRLINHWGYTVATYDSDAIPVKNPQTLFAKFEDSDLVGSSGDHPHYLYEKWKSATMCMGMALFKASKATGMTAFLANYFFCFKYCCFFYRRILEFFVNAKHKQNR